MSGYSGRLVRLSGWGRWTLLDVEGLKDVFFTYLRLGVVSIVIAAMVLQLRQRWIYSTVTINHHTAPCILNCARCRDQRQSTLRQTVSFLILLLALQSYHSALVWTLWWDRWDRSLSTRLEPAMVERGTPWSRLLLMLGFWHILLALLATMQEDRLMMLFI